MTTNTLSLLERCKTALIELPFDSGTLIKDLEAAIAEQTKLPEKEYFCFCDKNASLQMVSGGAAKEGYLGRVTLKIDDKYVDYIRAEQAKPSQVNSQEPVWYHGIDKNGCNRFYHKDEARPSEFSTGLYTSPQLKPLSRGELIFIAAQFANFDSEDFDKIIEPIARAIEAKLGVRHG